MQVSLTFHLNLVTSKAKYGVFNDYSSRWVSEEVEHNSVSVRDTKCKISFLRKVMHQSQHKAVKYHCFVTENLCYKSGKVACIKSLLNFTLKIECFYKTKQITMILTYIHVRIMVIRISSVHH